MAYTLIYGQNGNSSITIADGESNTIGNLTFPGRNFSGYGSPVDQNFLSMAENFASSDANTGPQRPLTGQLWFSPGTAVSNVFSNSSLKLNVANTSGVANLPPVWYNLVYADTNGNIALGNGNITVGNISVTGNITGNNANITNSISIGANANIAVNLFVGGNANISGNSNITGSLTASSANITGNITSNGTMSLTNPAASHTIAGSLAVTGSITTGAGNFAITTTSLAISDPIFQLAFDANNAPLTQNPDATGIAMHSVGTSTVVVGNASSGSNVINVTSSVGITTGKQIGANVAGIPLGAIVGNILSATSIDIKYPNNASALTTAAIPAGSNIIYGSDYYRFMGWDNSATEFAFMSNANVTISNNHIGTSNTYGNIRFAGGTAELLLTTNGGITSNGSINLPTSSVLTIGNSSIASNIAAGNLRFYGNGFNLYNIDLAKTNIDTYLANPSNPLASLTVTGNANVGNLNATGNILAANITANTAINAPTFNGNLVGNVTGNIVGTTGNFQTLTVLKTGNENTQPGLTVRYITTGAAGTTGNIQGQWTLTPGSFLEACFADLAERHHSDREYVTGTVMTVGGINEVTAANQDDKVLGVVSDKYAYLMNGDAGPQQTHPAVAYVGRLPVRVVGPVHKHDVVSPLDGGVAAASKANGFGWSLETNLEPGEKLVLCIIK
jgi:hypothetical protein